MLLLLLPHSESDPDDFVQIFGQLHGRRKHENITTANISKSFQVRLSVCWCRPLMNHWRTRLSQVPCEVEAFKNQTHFLWCGREGRRQKWISELPWISEFQSCFFSSIKKVARLIIYLTFNLSFKNLIIIHNASEISLVQMDFLNFHSSNEAQA